MHIDYTAYPFHHLNMKYTYPDTPVSIPSDLLTPSSQFKLHAWKVFGSILFFIAFYFGLVTVTAFLALGCWYIGLAILSIRVSYITLALALGIWAIALLVFFFLFKFIFTSNKQDYSDMIEITAQEEPELFDFIAKVAAETQTPFPKRVFLAPGVSAYVSYDSNFWSLFLPVRKNLTLGLGLINTVNLSEFKAIIGHEFGHFFQRSMKLGSYIYHVNRIIYNMLYDNSGYNKLLGSWAEINGAFALMSNITIWLLEIIQKLLVVAYGVINRAYSGLSKQMEFHADAVAASVAGSNHLAPALYRLTASEICYQHLMGLYNSWVEEQYKPQNIYPQHTRLMDYFAKDFQTNITHGLLQVNQETMNRFSPSNIVIKDQWASHPSSQEREDALSAINIVTPTCHESPWTLFSDAGKLQRNMTNLLFSSVTFKETPTLLTDDLWEKKLETERRRYQLPDIYKTFYDGRPISGFQAAEVKPASEPLGIEELLTEDVLNLPLKINTNESDLNLLNQIAESKGHVKTFDYKGEKFHYKNTEPLKARLEQEKTTLNAALWNADEQLFAHALGKGDTTEQAELIVLFKTYFKALEGVKGDEVLLNQMQTNLSKVYNEPMAMAVALAWQSDLKKIEATFKAALNVLLSHREVPGIMTSQQHDVVNRYLEKDLIYFSNNGFDNPALQLLGEVLGLYIQLLSDYLFELKKQALTYQANLLDTSHS